MPRSIGVFGAGPGLGRAVARRYAREGYEVVLVARDRQPLDVFAQDLAGIGASAHVITADLADTDAVPALAERIRAATGELDALYYAPTPDHGFVPAAELTPQRAHDFMPLSLLFAAGSRAAVPAAHDRGALRRDPDRARGQHRAWTAEHERPRTGAGRATQLPAVLTRRSRPTRASTSACSTSVQSSRTAPSTSETEEAKAAGTGRDWEMPTVDPAHLADLLWNMHDTKGESEAKYPE